MEKLYSLYDCCTLCPRECGKNRTNRETGVCGETAVLRSALASLHYWEEPIISGTKGSGAVFFSGCPLKCIFCQNSSISHLGDGRELDSKRLAEIFFELRDKGAHNINLVTAQHFLPHICDGLSSAKSHGLSLPIVYNTSGYEKSESLGLLERLVDIYLPDFKYLSPDLAGKLSLAPDYPERALGAIEEMLRQVGDPIISEGLMKKGVIVRHLVLPGHTHESVRIIDRLYSMFGNSIVYSIMCQYTPPQTPTEHKELNRLLTKREYSRVLDCLLSKDIDNAFYQQLSSADSRFVPIFDGSGI